VKKINLNNFQKILIVGDSGRGKSTLAKSLSEKLKIKAYSTDDYFWKTKYTVEADRHTSLKKISQVYAQNSWIVEGATRSLVREGIIKSDLILYLVYPNLISQFWFLFKRKLTRKNETWLNLFKLYKHLFRKKYKLGPQKGKDSLDEILLPYKNKTLILSSFGEINQLLL
jgi:adenylate kinase family enzyme